MTNETTASQPKAASIADDAQFQLLLTDYVHKDMARRDFDRDGKAQAAFEVAEKSLLSFIDGRTSTALTDAQITAGSNILCDCPEPKRIGRNAAIDVFQAMGGVAQSRPELSVLYCAMPESNGKSNWTATLTRKGDTDFDAWGNGFTFSRSEYPDRVRYEADCMRYLIGEISDEPCILSYDSEKHSGYAEAVPQPVAAAQAVPYSCETGQIDEALANFLAEHTRLNQDGIDTHAMAITLAINYAALNPTPESDIAEWREQGYLPPVAQDDVLTDRETLIACLGDDAAKLADANPDDEMAQTMREAAAMLEADGAAQAVPEADSAERLRSLLLAGAKAISTSNHTNPEAVKWALAVQAEFAQPTDTTREA